MLTDANVLTRGRAELAWLNVTLQMWIHRSISGSVSTVCVHKRIHGRACAEWLPWVWATASRADVQFGTTSQPRCKKPADYVVISPSPSSSLSPVVTQVGDVLVVQSRRHRQQGREERQQEGVNEARL